MIDTRKSSRRDAAQLVHEFRLVVTELLVQPWGPESPFIDGIRIVARQLMRLEGAQRDAIDDELILELLPIIDAIERARRQAHAVAPEQARRFDHALGGLVRAMMRFGVHPERPLGHPFDPKIHEAVGTQSLSSLPPDRVVDIMERGWSVGNRPLRLSKVVVSKPHAAA